MSVSLEQQINPHEITSASVHPILWLSIVRTVIMAKLIVPWEKGMEAAYERKEETQNELSAACTDAGWKASIYQLVEVSCRGFNGKYTQQLLKVLRIIGSWRRKLLRQLALAQKDKGS